MNKIITAPYKTETDWNTSIEPELILTTVEDDYDIWSLIYRVTPISSGTHSNITEFWDIRSEDLEAMGQQLIDLGKKLKKVERLI